MDELLLDAILEVDSYGVYVIILLISNMTLIFKVSANDLKCKSCK